MLVYKRVDTVAWASVCAWKTSTWQWFFLRGIWKRDFLGQGGWSHGRSMKWLMCIFHASNAVAFLGTPWPAWNSYHWYPEIAVVSVISWCSDTFCDMYIYIHVYTYIYICNIPMIVWYIPSFHYNLIGISDWNPMNCSLKHHMFCIQIPADRSWKEPEDQSEANGGLQPQKSG
jgi:hypothetical protein